MGMYSAFREQNIEIIKEGLSEEKAHELLAHELLCVGEIDFSVWDNHKIDGYWYDSTKQKLDAIAPYIRGYAEFQYESQHTFRIVFKNGEWYYQRGKIDWDNIELHKIR